MRRYEEEILLDYVKRVSWGASVLKEDQAESE